MNHQYYVYIMTNEHNTILYTGVTDYLMRRVYEHKERLGGGFASRYNVNKLVYYETAVDAQAAIARGKQIKAGSRQRTIDLVNRLNPECRDLYDTL